MKILFLAFCMLLFVGSASSQGKFTFTETTIAASDSLTPVINGNGAVLVGIKGDTAWTAARISVLGGSTVQDTNFVPVYDSSGAVINFYMAANVYITLPREVTMGINIFKLKSGIHESAVAQAAARKLKLLWWYP